MTSETGEKEVLCLLSGWIEGS
eukprot:SAG11_NODE_43685_length_163_cov_3.500000_2_plen_21_part_01